MCVCVCVYICKGSPVESSVVTYQIPQSILTELYRACVCMCVVVAGIEVGVIVKEG